MRVKTLCTVHKKVPRLMRTSASGRCLLPVIACDKCRLERSSQVVNHLRPVLAGTHQHTAAPGYDARACLWPEGGGGSGGTLRENPTTQTRAEEVRGSSVERRGQRWDWEAERGGSRRLMRSEWRGEWMKGWRGEGASCRHTSQPT